MAKDQNGGWRYSDGHRFDFYLVTGSPGAGACATLGGYTIKVAAPTAGRRRPLPAASIPVVTLLMIGTIAFSAMAVGRLGGQGGGHVEICGVVCAILISGGGSWGAEFNFKFGGAASAPTELINKITSIPLSICISSS